jgi:hypothetical protein
VAQIERWNGDVLPALLFEGSLKGGDEEVGAMVRERQGVVAEINEVRAPEARLTLWLTIRPDLARTARIFL